MKAIRLGQGNSVVTFWKDGSYVVLESSTGQRITISAKEAHELQEAFSEWFPEETIEKKPVDGGSDITTVDVPSSHWERLAVKLSELG